MFVSSSQHTWLAEIYLSIVTGNNEVVQFDRRPRDSSRSHSRDATPRILKVLESISSIHGQLMNDLVTCRRKDEKPCRHCVDQELHIPQLAMSRVEKASQLRLTWYKSLAWIVLNSHAIYNGADICRLIRDSPK